MIRINWIVRVHFKGYCMILKVYVLIVIIRTTKCVIFSQNGSEVWKWNVKSDLFLIQIK